ncbi:excinuclease ABC subunit B [candidate division WOR-1 bacterium RIFOXYB2_FULL_42_35]|uniref:UvrABC system protein B n=1 Tax=candidate division WOR-1 bacterium RIFOXYC2_FULL_41_25 TaxID=1802586 RepID=A0A1F4TRX6_UNCSA|nr:MAG: excinuclease ABC subunit B [candidate division WOR-1 bacterium RIFOXYA2_FULL_41_14]OGC25772.1 MAG: excinuclease ABC subunit B [candidate division WOR-1 bacterium RIFOXYB2_FULL_42_35]OGC35406.1 MAG: excinuclease ABC subunit B [candidate division WOR-1 bacterium RIFOXYC2_FULL_41_25]
MPKFKLVSKYKPQGDQPEAIKNLVKGLEAGDKFQTLLGITGSGKTFTMANVIEQVQRPTLVISPNKTLAAQLCQEFRSFFPNNAVNYFVSFYDYYQPEAYIPHTDTYIEKDSSINQEIDRLRHEATMSVLERRDVIVVASVSCIYALGRPEDYKKAVLILKAGQKIIRDEIISHLVSTKYERNDLEVSRGKFRVRGDVIELQPAYDKNFLRIELSDDKIEKISEVEAVTRRVLASREMIGIYPGTHYVTFEDKMQPALESIKKELDWRLPELKKQKKLLEAQRLEQRTKYDLEMIREMGYCNGIENYSRHFDQREPGEPPGTLIDYFPDDFLLFIDESHVTVPQLNAMYEGDKARKTNLVDYGFRLPSALDNRPLQFKEFEQRLNQVVFVSATPAAYELKHSKQKVEQIIRPTGLIDPEVVVKKPKGQVNDLIKEIKERVAKNERVLVTTLTKRMAEDLSEYLNEAGIRVRYLHSDVKTLDRIEILRGLRLGKFDVLVGINLLREGLDLPEVSLVAILDADKEGFLRSETSLIQTVGRAARNINGKVILYAENMTGSMERALKETNRRRAIQIAYNKKYKIKPTTITKEIHDISEGIKDSKLEEIRKLKDFIPKEEVPDIIRALEEEMQTVATELNFEKAAEIRDRVKELKKAFGLPALLRRVNRQAGLKK